MPLKNLVPTLNISDIEASLEFYREALGFDVVSDPAAVREWRWATIRSGYTERMLSEARHAPPADKSTGPRDDSDWPVIFYFYPDDVVALYAQVIAQGFEPNPLEATFYGMREFSLTDPDGQVLSFGQDSKRPG